jgi:hypothetical protein
MKHWQQQQTNRNAIKNLQTLALLNNLRPPSYNQAVAALNRLAITTSRGNPWTPKRLFRMLQRNGIRGLHGLCASMKEQSNTLFKP